MMKKNLRITLLIGMLFFALHMLHAQELTYTPHPEDTYPTFSLTLKAKAPEFRVGSLVRIMITQTNLTNHVIDFTSTWTGVDSSFEYEAIDEDGKPAERKPRGTGVRDVHPSNILPGGSGESSVLVDRSNSITITITG